MKLFTFVFINFVVSFISDIVLNDLSNPPQPFIFNSEIINSLQTYFKNKSIIVAGIYAGITICLSLLLVCFISELLFRFYVPNNLYELLLFCGLAFPIGFLIDIVIDKLNIFGKSLQPYYKIAGSGLWGAIAFIFSIVISYSLQKYVVPLLS